MLTDFSFAVLNTNSSFLIGLLALLSCLSLVRDLISVHKSWQYPEVRLQVKVMQPIYRVSTLCLKISQVLKHGRWDAVITQPIMFYLIYLIIYNWLILSTGMYFLWKSRPPVQRVPVNNRAFVSAAAPHWKLRLFFNKENLFFSSQSGKVLSWPPLWLTLC